MRRTIVVITLVLVCSVGIFGCARGSETASLDSPPASAPVEQAERSDVVYRLSLDSLVLAAGTDKSVTFTMSNSGDTTATAVDFLGIRIFDDDDEVAFDTHEDGKPIYPTVSIGLGPGETRSVSFDFVVPPTGDYRMVGVLQDDTEAGALDFTSTPLH